MLDSHLEGMTFFAPSTRIVLHSNLCPEECARRLGQAIDPEDFTVFSLSNYRGTKTFLGKVEGLRFRLFRRGYRNIPTVLSAEFLAQGKGSRIEGAFDLDPTTKKLLRIVSLAGFLLLMLAAVNAVRTHTLLPWMVVGIASIYFTTMLLGP
jgi:hypothetical protein